MHFEPPRPRSHDERILPLINVVFLLLIFFMIVGRIATVDPFELEPPKSASEGLPDKADSISLALSADGELALNGEAIDREMLESRIQELLEAEPKPQLLLKADGGAEAERVLEVLELLRAAGGERMQLLTLPAAK